MDRRRKRERERKAEAKELDNNTRKTKKEIYT
jgi:hypothetical protein